MKASGSKQMAWIRLLVRIFVRWGQLPAVAVFACLGLLTSCAVVESQVVKDQSTAMPDGIPYFLPRRPFIVTVSMPVSGVLPIITVAPGNAEPELTQQFVLSQGTNLLANNEFNVTVGANGLLKSSASTATSQVTTALQNAAASAALFAAPVPVGPADLRVALALPRNVNTTTPSSLGTGPSIGCPPPGGSYQYAVYVKTRYDTPLTFCTSYTVTWTRADGKTDPYGTPNQNATQTGSWVSGLFFRHELPYVVTVQGPSTTANTVTKNDFIVTSPDESETDFFPIRRSFFANNTANITLTDGVLTGVDQTTTSELAALVGLPATFVSSYTTAVGQLFAGLTSNSSAQQKLLGQLQATAVTQNQASVVAAAQYQVCTKTVGSYNWGSLSPADAATALAAIKTACPGN